MCKLTKTFSVGELPKTVNDMKNINNMLQQQQKICKGKLNIKQYKNKKRKHFQFLQATDRINIFFNFFL